MSFEQEEKCKFLISKKTGKFISNFYTHNNKNHIKIRKKGINVIK